MPYLYLCEANNPRCVHSNIKNTAYTGKTIDSSHYSHATKISYNAVQPKWNKVWANRSSHEIFRDKRAVTSVAVLAEISLRSPRKLFIFII